MLGKLISMQEETKNEFGPELIVKVYKKSIGLEGFLGWIYMLTDAQIAKFQMLYKEQFGKDISREEALEKGIKLMRLVELVYRPITQEEHDAAQHRKKPD